MKELTKRKIKFKKKQKPNKKNIDDELTFENSATFTLPPLGGRRTLNHIDEINKSSVLKLPPIGIRLVNRNSDIKTGSSIESLPPINSNTNKIALNTNIKEPFDLNDIDEEGESATSLFTTENIECFDSLDKSSSKYEQSDPRLDEMIRKIDNAESIKGSVNGLMYTHNTNAIGLLGFLSSGRMIATIESNVNFRYGIDSRYSGGVTLIMKDGFEKNHINFRLHDLYNQNKYLMGNSREEYDYSKLTSYINSITDFRHIQMESMNSKLLPLDELNKREINTALALRYQMSLVNPQIRIPWADNKITPDNVDAILVASEIDKQITELGYELKVESSFKSFSNYIQRIPGGPRDFEARSSVARALDNTKGIQAIKKYKRMKELGKIKVINFSGDLFSHEAGRTTSKARTISDDIALENAAKLGLDIHEKYYIEKMNNSPSALSMKALTEFEKAYFHHLLDKKKFIL